MLPDLSHLRNTASVGALDDERITDIENRLVLLEDKVASLTALDGRVKNTEASDVVPIAVHMYGTRTSFMTFRKNIADTLKIDKKMIAQAAPGTKAKVIIFVAPDTGRIADTGIKDSASYTSMPSMLVEGGASILVVLSSSKGGNYSDHGLRYAAKAASVKFDRIIELIVDSSDPMRALLPSDVNEVNKHSFAVLEEELERVGVTE